MERGEVYKEDVDGKLLGFLSHITTFPTPIKNYPSPY